MMCIFCFPFHCVIWVFCVLFHEVNTANPSSYVVKWWGYKSSRFCSRCQRDRKRWYFSRKFIKFYQ